MRAGEILGLWITLNLKTIPGDLGKWCYRDLSVIPQQLLTHGAFLSTIGTCPTYKTAKKRLYCARPGQWETSRPQRSCPNGPLLPVSTLLGVKWMNALRFPEENSNASAWMQHTAPDPSSTRISCRLFLNAISLQTLFFDFKPPHKARWPPWA